MATPPRSPSSPAAPGTPRPPQPPSGSPPRGPTGASQPSPRSGAPGKPGAPGAKIPASPAPPAKRISAGLIPSSATKEARRKAIVPLSAQQVKLALAIGAGVLALSITTCICLTGQPRKRDTRAQGTKLALAAYKSAITALPEMPQPPSEATLKKAISENPDLPEGLRKFKDSWGNNYIFSIRPEQEWIFIISPGPNGKYEEGKGDDLWVFANFPQQDIPPSVGPPSDQ